MFLFFLEREKCLHINCKCKSTWQVNRQQTSTEQIRNWSHQNRNCDHVSEQKHDCLEQATLYWRRLAFLGFMSLYLICTNWCNSQLPPLCDEISPKTVSQLYWVMLVIMAQNVKTSASSNRSDHINRTKSCFPPPSDVTQRSVSHIRLPVDSVRVWVREREENRRPLIFWGFFLI